MSLVWGIVAVLGMLVGFMPLFGALNWLNIPFAGVGAIVSGVALSRSPAANNRTMVITGLVCCVIAMMLGAIRLVLGLGVL